MGKYKKYKKLVKNSQRVFRCLDWSSFVSPTEDGRRAISGCVGVLCLIGTILYVLSLFAAPTFSPQVALCYCKTLYDPVLFVADGNRASTLNALISDLNNKLNFTGVLSAQSQGSYVLSPVCPYHNPGTLCSSRCLREVTIKDHETKELLYPDVGLRACPKAKELNPDDPSEYVQCFLDSSVCNTLDVAAPVGALQAIGATWGWVTLFILVFVLIWNWAYNYWKTRRFLPKLEESEEEEDQKVLDDVEDAVETVESQAKEIKTLKKRLQKLEEVLEKLGHGEQLKVEDKVEEVVEQKVTKQTKEKKKKDSSSDESDGGDSKELKLEVSNE